MSQSSFVLQKDLQFTDAGFYAKSGDIVVFTPPQTMVVYRNGDLQIRMATSQAAINGLLITEALKPVSDEVEAKAPEEVKVPVEETKPEEVKAPAEEIKPEAETEVAPAETETPEAETPEAPAETEAAEELPVISPEAHEPDAEIPVAPAAKPAVKAPKGNAKKK